MTVLFVCRHGAAKSILADADFRTLASLRGLQIEATAAGLDPAPEVAPVLLDALPADALDQYKPRMVTAADVAAASRVITFNLAPGELPISGPLIERWDDIPSVSDNFEAARASIGLRLQRLIEGYSSPDAG